MEGDLQLDQDTFITKLALTILEGRSFDITGKKCSYERLFENVEMVIAFLSIKTLFMGILGVKN